MANPQVEDGFTRIANTLLESLARIRVPGEARQVFDVILRKTYGFGKKEDAISLSQFVVATSLSKPHVCDALKRLRTMNLITENGKGIAKNYSVFKDFSLWKPLPKKRKAFPNSGKEIENNQQIQGEEGDASIPENGNDCKIVPENRKNRSRIQVLQKKVSKEIYIPNSFELRTSELLLSLICQRNPNFKQPDLQKWASHIDKMVRIDKRSHEDIERVICWCQANGFWQNNILSTEKLRKQFDALYLKMTAEGNGRPATGQVRYF